MAEQTQSAPSKPIVACLRCREQKLKCGRELPTCERCRKQDAACTYPAPPDRKRIAAEKTKRAKASQPNSARQAQDQGSPATEGNAAKKRRLSHNLSDQFGCLAEPDAAELPSTEIGLLLAEVYYKRAYNAHLMFHKTISFQVYMLNKTPDYLLRAQFAHAALFLQEVEPQYQKHVKAFPMQTLYDLSWSWAHAASTQVLSHVDEPSVLKIQTLQVLQQFYWARGEIIRAKVHASLAYRLSQLLGYDKLYESDPSSINPSLKFDREIRRASFWASWATLCLHSEEIPRIWESAVSLPLPARISPGGSIQGVELTHGQTMGRLWRLHENGISNDVGTTSLMAELMKLVGIWARVRTAVTDLRLHPTSVVFEEKQCIEESLHQLQPSMEFPVEEMFSKAAAYDASPEFLVCVCSVYYLSCVFLESLKYRMSPEFASHIPGGTQELPHSGSVLVCDQSLKFVELIRHLVTAGLDITRLWHVTGFTAFIVARVLLSQYSSHELTGCSRTPGPDSDEIKTCQTVLEVLSIYWKPLRILLADLNSTIEATRSKSAVSNFVWDFVNFLSDVEPASSASTIT